MNLEEITQETFLEKLRRKTRKLVIPLILTTAFATIDCSKKKKTPFEPEPTPDKQEIVLTTSTTNQQGITSFVDNQTEEDVTVKVQDSQTKTPINNISIDYLDGKDFKTYYVQDPNKNYLPAVFVYPHNSEKIIELSPVIIKAFIDQVIQGEEEHKALYSWKSEVTNAWRDYAYVKTISKDEMLEQREVEYAIFDIAAELATIITGYNPLSEYLSFSDFIKWLDGWKYFKDGVIAERWDIYHVKGGSKTYNGKTIQFGAEYLDMIPSNIPNLTLNEPKVEGSNVTLTWKGEDKTTYDNLSFFYTSQGFPQNDLTITQGSDPKKPDLFYSYKISKNNTIAFQDSTVDNYKIYKNLEDGNYTLEVLVQDEVKNKSNSITKNFKIEGKEEPPEEPPERLSKIAFVSDRDGNKEIYVMNSDGTNQVNITNHPTDDFDPDWSPDGSKIVFASNRSGITSEIYTMNSDGTDIMQLTYSKMDSVYNRIEYILTPWNKNPAWSPDGNKIAFGSSIQYLGLIEDIYVMNIDGTDQVNLTNSKWPYGDIDERSPDWSPDGTKIVMERQEGTPQIYIMNSDGTNRIKLTNNFFCNQLPSWSPDGNKIAFYSDSNLYLMDVNGTIIKQLTNFGFVWKNSWSPDGSKIVFDWLTGDKSWNFYVINIDGTGLRQLTDYKDYEGWNYAPSWSPYLDK